MILVFFCAASSHNVSSTWQVMWVVAVSVALLNDPCAFACAHSARCSCCTPVFGVGLFFPVCVEDVSLRVLRHIRLQARSRLHSLANPMPAHTGGVCVTYVRAIVFIALRSRLTYHVTFAKTSCVFFRECVIWATCRWLHGLRLVYDKEFCRSVVWVGSVRVENARKLLILQGRGRCERCFEVS